MTLRYNRELYPKTVVIKAAYHFTDIAYIHLDADESYYIVEITPKAGKSLDKGTFENEILAQTARYEVFLQTKEIREISLARAMASSVVEDTEKEKEEEKKTIPESIPLDNILKDWFRKK